MGSTGCSSSEVSGMMGSTGCSSPEASAVEGLIGDSSSDAASAIVKSDRVAMLMGGDCVTGDPGIVSVSREVADSSGGD